MSDQTYIDALQGFPRRHENELAVLLYHGVSDTPSEGIENASRKHLPAEEFETQMRYLHENCALLSIDEVVELTRAEKPFPRRAVTVTFDDGFRNNHTVAAPILDRFAVPAVFYICSGMISTDLMFWVDQLEDCLNLTGKSSISVELDELRCFTLESREDRLNALQTIKAYCKIIEKAAKEQIIAEVSRAAEVIPAVGHALNYEKLSWLELAAMDRRPMFTIGGHTPYHDILSSQCAPERNAAIRLSLDLLSFNLGHPIAHFSYPEGQANHYGQSDIDTLKDLGVVCSPSAIAGLNPPGAELFHLKRIMVGFDGVPFPFDDPRLG